MNTLLSRIQKEASVKKRCAGCPALPAVGCEKRAFSKAVNALGVVKPEVFTLVPIVASVPAKETVLESPLVRLFRPVL